MKRSENFRWLLAALALLGIAWPAGAQLLPGQRRYVEFKIERTAEEILKERMELDQFKEILKKIAADPSTFDPEKIKDLKLDESQKEKALEWLANEPPEVREALRQFAEEKANDKNPAQVKEFQEDLKKIVDTANDPNRPRVPARESEPGEIDLGAFEEESVGKFAEQAMKRAEETKLGDWLRDSPSWNRAFRDLRQSMNEPGKPNWQGNILKEKLGGKTWELGEGAFERLQDLPRPKLDAVKDSIPKLQNLPTPNLGVPAMSDWSGPALPTLSTGAVWLLLALLFLLSAWQALRWRRRAAQAAPERATLGPWPVQPEAVGTRRELIQAFDYLALWTLGLSAQSWNHQAVARRWGEQAPLHLESARSLASLYEQARYTDGVEELTGEERDLARRTLLQLKEAL